MQQYRTSKLSTMYRSQWYNRYDQNRQTLYMITCSLLLIILYKMILNFYDLHLIGHNKQT
jgi:hypothetical protein